MKIISQRIIGIILIVMLLASTDISLAVSESEINEQKKQQNQINNKITETEEKKKDVENE